jgi:DNA-binding beta-propeller fold protein YncE
VSAPRLISKRLSILIILGIWLIGPSALGYRYANHNHRYYQIHQPTRVAAEPHFLYPINTRAEGIGRPMAASIKNGRLNIIGDAGRLLVADRDGTNPKVFDLGKLGGDRSARSMAIDDRGRVYVAMMESGRVLILDGPLRNVINKRFGASELKCPIGLACDKKYVYVTDVGDHSVKIFTMKGELIKKLGAYGDSDIDFAYPNGAAVAADGRIYVADSNHGRVQVFDKTYKFISSLPQPPQRMRLPRSAAIDRMGRIHVVDTLRGLIDVYDAEHNYLFNYGQGAPGGAKLNCPNSISIDEETGLIFITDCYNDRVTVWAD